MERSDLGNYRRIYRDGNVNLGQMSALVVFSLLKYARRMLIYLLYLRWKK
jgi:hypothetical protein